MKAYITSTGEPTTALCQWALERNGFETFLIEDSSTSLWKKLKTIYELADDDFVRVDADIIVNKRFTPAMLTWLPAKNSDCWWWQFICFDMLKLDKAHCMSYIRKDAIPALRANVDKAMNSNRPETDMSRIQAFFDPRRLDTYSDELMGLHGLHADLNRAKKLKHIRNQQDLYDFEMAERIQNL